VDYTDSRPLDEAADSTAESAVTTLKQVLRPEKRKMILPVLMCLFLALTVALTMVFRAQGLEQQYSEPVLEGSSELRKLSLEAQYFNESVSADVRNKARTELESFERQWRSDLFSLDPVSKAPFLIGGAYFSDAFPLLPAQPSIVGAATTGSDNQFTDFPFPRSKGYVLSEDLFAAQAKLFYIQRRYSLLSSKIEENRENWTLQRFRSKASEIEQTEYSDPEVPQYLKDPLLPVEDGAGPVAESPLSMGADSLVLEPLESGIKEVRFYHFIPSFLATFALYYVINAFIVAGLRDFRQDIESWSLDEGFFLNNIVASSLVSILLVTVSKMIIPVIIPLGSVSVLGIVATAASAVLWTAVFAVIVNEFRKLTRYAWIISGASISILLAMLELSLATESSVSATFVLGASAAYPLMLGALSEYGRIHGEHFLERTIRDREAEK
jgi:hypothetical protein